MCSRGLSQIIKIVLVMLISGVLLSEKHPTTYQLGLWYLLTLKRYDKHPYPFPIAFSTRSAPKNKDLPQSPPTSNIYSVPKIPFT